MLLAETKALFVLLAAGAAGAARVAAIRTAATSAHNGPRPFHFRKASRLQVIAQLYSSRWENYVKPESSAYA